jgi:predicted deacylase
MMIVRENTEGEYSSVGATMYAGTAREIVVQQSIFSRHGADRVLRPGPHVMISALTHGNEVCGAIAVAGLLDLHSMHERSQPLLLSGPLEKGVQYAQQVGAPAAIICDAGHPEGRRLPDYAGFGDARASPNALLVECGQHWEAAAVKVARDCAARVLIHSGIVDSADLPIGWKQPDAAPSRVIRVTHAVVAQSMDFRFADSYTGLEEFSTAGTVIGWNAGDPVLTPYDRCVLVMPSLRQLRPGVTVVRFGRSPGSAEPSGLPH